MNVEEVRLSAQQTAQWWLRREGRIIAQTATITRIPLDEIEHYFPIPRWVHLRAARCILSYARDEGIATGSMAEIQRLATASQKWWSVFRAAARKLLNDEFEAAEPSAVEHRHG